MRSVRDAFAEVIVRGYSQQCLNQVHGRSCEVARERDKAVAACGSQARLIHIRRIAPLRENTGVMHIQHQQAGITGDEIEVPIPNIEVVSVHQCLIVVDAGNVHRFVDEVSAEGARLDAESAREVDDTGNHDSRVGRLRAEARTLLQLVAGLDDDGSAGHQVVACGERDSELHWIGHRHIPACSGGFKVQPHASAGVCAARCTELAQHRNSEITAPGARAVEIASQKVGI
jgi:hypothetical protein